MKKYISLVILIIVIFVLTGCMNNLSKKSFGFGLDETNPETCDKIEASASKDTCYNMVAVNIKDSTLCEKIVGLKQKNICYSGVANKLRDSSLCEKITDSGIKKLCYDNFE